MLTKTTINQCPFVVFAIKLINWYWFNVVFVSVLSCCFICIAPLINPRRANWICIDWEILTLYHVPGQFFASVGPCTHWTEEFPPVKGRPKSSPSRPICLISWHVNECMHRVLIDGQLSISNKPCKSSFA